MRKLLLGIVVLLGFTVGAQAQCTGVFPANTLCGNLGASPAPPAAFTASGTVVGPGSSTTNDLAAWGNSSGTLLKDMSVGSGLSTGGGTLNLTLAGALGFQFNKNGVAQTGLTNNAYTRITWPNTRFNTTGTAISSDQWTAPFSGLMILSFDIFCDACLNTPNAGNPTFDGKFIRNEVSPCNGSDLNAVLGGPSLGGAPNTAFSSGSAVVQITAGDVIELCSFATSVDGMNDIIIDGNIAHTWWSGAYLR